MAQTRPEAGMWPLLTDRVASVAFFVVVAAVGRRSPRLPVNLAMLAVFGGALSPVVTLSSLYPASTVLLGRAILGERLSAWQAAGVVSALIAVVLIVGG